MFIERKRGEFADGVREGYLEAGLIVERSMFLRAAALVLGRHDDASSKRLAATCDYTRILAVTDAKFDEYGVAVTVLRQISLGQTRRKRRLAVLQAYVALIIARLTAVKDRKSIEEIAAQVRARWTEVLIFAEAKTEGKYKRTVRDRTFFNPAKFIASRDVIEIVRAVFVDDSARATAEAE